VKFGFVTSNTGKYEEMRLLFAQDGFELERIDLRYPELQVETLEATIMYGLEWIVGRYYRPFLIDDSGLFVEALNGFPGVYSAYVHRTLGNEGILRLLEGQPSRRARFECAIGFAGPDFEPILAKGIAEGSIAAEPRGTGGFGYDPIFVPEGGERTFAEMDLPDKNAISHRGRAVKAFLRKFRAQVEMKHIHWTP